MLLVLSVLLLRRLLATGAATVTTDAPERERREPEPPDHSLGVIV